ncbi:UBC-like protein [Westerdykella ornata]|uniref:UBC-like protein n=1 Tax=Westerdykella ornata TaxID=318751 RepID=A0A6A6JLJ2_WESOR|nr:UBC-like protein [Westerdykella ornata]KAF2277105.1 UBC-like protein [Westerdykella ornata]
MPSLGPSPALLSFRKQNLLVEFSSLRSAPLDGVFMSITPGDPSLWVGVLFVRKGPYAPAVLRFQISFPPNYPTLPPLVTFSTDVFHPLLTPLTTYTYTTGSSDTDTVSATDEERLPPGGFSLRHGFPQWFGRARKSAGSRDASASSVCSTSQGSTPRPARGREDETTSSQLAASTTAAGKGVTIVKVLHYIRSTFSDEVVLDSIPLQAAANPGAYHAWRSYRSESLQAQKASSVPSTSTASMSHLGVEDKAVDNDALGRNRRPGDWNWEGVWEERVRKAVKGSLSDSVLYGGGVPGEDIIRFRDGDEDTLQRMKTTMEAAISRAAALG